MPEWLTDVTNGLRRDWFYRICVAPVVLPLLYVGAFLVKIGFLIIERKWPTVEADGYII